MDDMVEMKTVTLCMPAVDVKFLNALSKRMGWKKVSQSVVNSVSEAVKPAAKAKNTELDLAIEDVREGRVSRVFASADELCKHLGI